jgi:carboxymethylenebutenolidase
VLMWPDSGGLRPAFRELGRRIAAAGYSALVPNHLYRTAKAPVFDESFNPVKNPADRGKYRRITAPFFAPGAAERDADAYAAFLDAQQQVNRKKKLGVHGYCLGGIHVMKTAAAFPPAAAQACRSTAVYWPPTSPTARTCSRRGSRRGCILRLRPMTTSASRR